MAVRTDITVVTKLLGPNYDTKKGWDLAQFIDTAANLVARVEACAIKKGFTPALTEAQLELLERWLACHFYQRMDPGKSSKSTEGASASYQGQTSMHLDASFYGQTALGLDPSGCLASINEVGTEDYVAGGEWLGKRPIEQLDYEERR